MFLFSKKTQKRDGKPKKEQDHLEHIPFKLREIMKSKDKMKAGSLGSKKLRKGEQKSFQTLMKHCFWLEPVTNLVHWFSYLSSRLLSLKAIWCFRSRPACPAVQKELTWEWWCICETHGEWDTVCPLPLKEPGEQTAWAGRWQTGKACRQGEVWEEEGVSMQWFTFCCCFTLDVQTAVSRLHIVKRKFVI